MMATRSKQLDEAAPIDLTRAERALDRRLAERRLFADMLAAAVGDGTETRRWYVLRTGNHAERQVQIALDKSDIEAWVPEKTVYKPVFHSRKLKKTVQVIFRGYVFVRTVPCAFGFAGLLRVRGVSAIIGNDNGPISVADKSINDLMQLVVKGIFDEDKTGRPYKVGTEVRIKSGPFADFHGVLEGYAASRGVRVLTSLFGQQVPVELSLADIERWK